MKAKLKVRAPYLGPVTLWQSFLVLFLAGPLTGFGVAVWNAFFLDCRLRWRHLAVALLLCLALSLFRIHMVPGLVVDLVLATGWDGQTASHVVWIALASACALVLFAMSLQQLDAYRARLQTGPLPSGSILRAILAIGAAFALCSAVLWLLPESLSIYILRMFIWAL